MQQDSRMRRVKKDKRFGPRSKERKERMKLERNYNPGANEFVIRPEDGEQLRAAVKKSEDFRFQTLIDEWRTFKW